jgi:hypothetical protein
VQYGKIDNVRQFLQKKKGRIQMGQLETTNPKFYSKAVEVANGG